MTEEQLRKNGWLKPIEYARKVQKSLAWIYVQAKLGKLDVKQVKVTKEILYVKQK